MLRLWSHGTLEGSAKGTSGMLTVAVPVTSDCFFQADVSVTPVGGQPFFYSGARATVPGCGPVSTIAGDIFLCSAAGAPTTNEVIGGFVAATGPQSVASQLNPLTPTAVPSGTYSMTATAPPGYVFVGCGGSATVGSGGVSATESVTVSPHGTGMGGFYVTVAVPSGSLGGGSGPSGSTSPGGPTSPGGSLSPLGTVDHAARPQATPVSGSHLAFTGMNAAPLLLTGLVLLALGALATGAARIRRRTVVVARNSPPRR
jgi:hypothetical protein